MNPSEEAPESHVNGQTSQVRPPSSATVKAKPKPKKGNLSPGHNCLVSRKGVDESVSPWCNLGR